MATLQSHIDEAQRRVVFLYKKAKSVEKFKGMPVYLPCQSLEEAQINKQPNEVFIRTNGPSNQDLSERIEIGRTISIVENVAGSAGLDLVDSEYEMAADVGEEVRN